MNNKKAIFMVCFSALFCSTVILCFVNYTKLDSSDTESNIKTNIIEEATTFSTENNDNDNDNDNDNVNNDNANNDIIDVVYAEEAESVNTEFYDLIKSLNDADSYSYTIAGYSCNNGDTNYVNATITVDNVNGYTLCNYDFDYYSEGPTFNDMLNGYRNVKALYTNNYNYVEYLCGGSLYEQESDCYNGSLKSFIDAINYKLITDGTIKDNGNLYYEDDLLSVEFNNNDMTYCCNFDADSKDLEEVCYYDIVLDTEAGTSLNADTLTEAGTSFNADTLIEPTTTEFAGYVYDEELESSSEPTIESSSEQNDVNSEPMLVDAESSFLNNVGFAVHYNYADYVKINRSLIDNASTESEFFISFDVDGNIFQECYLNEFLQDTELATNNDGSIVIDIATHTVLLGGELIEESSNDMMVTSMDNKKFVLNYSASNNTVTLTRID